MVDDVKGLTAGISRKRGKRRYFWEYSEQLIPSKQERMLKPSEWDRETLPSNMYQKNGLHHGEIFTVLLIGSLFTFMDQRSGSSVHATDYNHRRSRYLKLLQIVAIILTIFQYLPSSLIY